jgi:dTDP-4-dehydrorhamnose reductase
MRIAVIGGGGRLGAVVTTELASRGHDVMALRSTQLDITNGASVEDVLGRLKPDAIVNCSAYNAVDAAQADIAAAFALNATGPSFLAAFATRTNALLIHYSTDFVFDGAGTAPYTEADTANPLSVYGASKLAGEHEAGRAPRHYVLRIESLFGGTGVKGHKSTVDHIADRIRTGDVVRAAIDRTVSPSYAPDAARATAELIERNADYGLYHCVNGGHTTWFDLAQEVARELGVSAQIVPLRADELTVVAPRPRFCALSNAKLLACGIHMPSWRSAIARHVASPEPAPLPVHSRVAAVRLA